MGRNGLAWVYSAVVTASIVVSVAFGFRHDRFPEVADGHVLLRVAGTAVLAGSVVHLSFAGWRWFRSRALKTWWDPSEAPDGPLKWNMVLDLTQGSASLDPLSVKAEARKSYLWKDLPWVALGAVATGGVAVTTLRFLADPHVPAVFAFDNGNNVANAAINLSGNLTAFLALIAAMISIFFTYHQLQAKVKADNRQSWITKLRGLVAKVTSLSYELHSVDKHRSDEIWIELGPLRIEFELMLNPSEEDHRLLMYLVQRLAPVEEEIQDFIKDARNFREIVNAKTNGSDSAAWDAVLESNDPGTLTGYIVRLSHVVLKREWERVKRTR